MFRCFLWRRLDLWVWGKKRFLRHVSVGTLGPESNINNNSHNIITIKITTIIINNNNAPELNSPNPGQSYG